MKRLDRGDVIRTIPLQEPAAVKLTGRDPDALRQAAHFVRLDGAVFAGAAAAREAARHLRGGWLVRGVTAIPGTMPLAERMYRWIARRWGPVG
jgi:predicted DCC family thiol-disulfide oxidoreductase YuxK